MNVIKTKIDQLLIIEPQVFEDARGFFVETYNASRYCDCGIKAQFVQDNLSQSSKGVLRGLHFQKSPHMQGKLVQVITGSVLDVAVDIRTSSPTYGQWVSVVLTSKNRRQFWIPEGFAHGFLTLEDHTIFSYKCTHMYAPNHDSGIMWNDHNLNIDWQFDTYGIKKPLISEKDMAQNSFGAIEKIIQEAC